ncbi:MAG: flagellar biosynthesis anti-sigma factor FlgM [Dehalococcoidia bacterium]
MAAPRGRQETRAERIERLRDLIARGAYNPSPEDVARAMIEKGF